jgi:hypothetical protein
MSLLLRRLDKRITSFPLSGPARGVHSRRARHAIARAADRGRCHYYLDCGNETDRDRVVLGEIGKAQHHRLPHVGDLFSELLVS